MKKCPQCGSEYPMSNPSCPKCGYNETSYAKVPDSTKQNKTFIIFAVVVGCIMLSGIIGFGVFAYSIKSKADNIIDSAFDQMDNMQNGAFDQMDNMQNDVLDNMNNMQNDILNNMPTLSDDFDDKAQDIKDQYNQNVEDMQDQYNQMVDDLLNGN